MDSIDLYEHSSGLSPELYRLKPEYYGLVYLSMPYNIERIQDDCFVGSLAKAVFVGRGVKIIGDRAFKDMKELRCVYLAGDVDCIGKDAFAGCENLTIFSEYGEGYFWVHPDEFRSFIGNMGREFHSSSGSWASQDFSFTADEPRPYNPLSRPLVIGADAYAAFKARALEYIPVSTFYSFG